MEPGRGDDARSALRGFFTALAVGLLGIALNRTNGTREGTALVMVLGALVCAALAVFLPARRPLPAKVSSALWAALAVLLGFHVFYLLTTPPGMYLRPIPIGQWPFAAGVAALAVSAGWIVSGPEAVVRRFAVPLLLVVVGLMAWWIFTASPSPFIDVFVFQRDGVKALVQGNNPYALRYPDIYGNSPFYGPGVSVNGVLQFGFPYLPTSLLWALPGQLALDDYRWSHLFGLLATGGLLWWAAPSRWTAIAALMLWSTPRFFFVLEQGWTEPMLVFLLALVVAIAVKRPKWLPWALGLLLSSKQYMAVLYPLALLLLPAPLSWRALWSLTWRAAAVVFALNLPFALWNFREYFWSVWELQFIQPFRTDALCLLSWFKPEGGPLEKWQVMLPFISAVPLLALMLRFGRRGPGEFALATGLLFGVFFVTSKQAFANYYFFPLGALCIGFAMLGRAHQHAPSAAQAAPAPQPEAPPAPQPAAVPSP